MGGNGQEIGRAENGRSRFPDNENDRLTHGLTFISLKYSRAWKKLMSAPVHHFHSSLVPKSLEKANISPTPSMITSAFIEHPIALTEISKINNSLPVLTLAFCPP